MPKAKSKRNVRDTAAGAPSDQATMVVTLYDGTRQPIQDKDFLIRIFDGFQNQLFDDFKPAPTTLFHLPFRDNLQDNCRVLASGDGYVDAGFTPIKLSPQAVAGVDLMLLQDQAAFKFQSWDSVKITDPMVATFIATGGSDADYCQSATSERAKSSGERNRKADNVQIEARMTTSLDTILRYQAAIKRDLYKALAALRAMRRERNDKG
jgi:hypothetical protein